MRTAIVTGAARGIGRGISLGLAKDGYVVAAVGTRSADDPGVKAYIEELTAISPDSFYLSADISSEEGREKIVTESFARLGEVDVLVNNAGVAPKVRADLLEMSEESFDYVLGVNLRGTFFLTQRVAQEMVKQKTDAFRAIVFTTSISADVSSINRGEYCMSKAGLGMAVKLYAHRLASEGINVYAVRPGIIATDMTAGVHEKYQNMIDGGLLPIARMGEPDDVAAAVCSLADGALRYSTGEEINVDGGFMLRRL